MLVFLFVVVFWFVPTPKSFCKCKETSYKYSPLLASFFTACLGYYMDNFFVCFYAYRFSLLLLLVKKNKSSITLEKYSNLSTKQQFPQQHEIPPNPENLIWLLDLGRTYSYSNWRTSTDNRQLCKQLMQARVLIFSNFEPPLLLSRLLKPY